MAYDLVTRRIVLFAGRDQSGLPIGDFWAWDGTTWTSVSPAAMPSARWSHGMTSDSARQRIVLFGGYDTQAARADTWEWNGTQWTPVTPLVSPSPRGSAGMDYDGARQRTVLFGGRAGTTLFMDTWEWNGVLWSARTTSTMPSARSLTALAFDPTRARMLLFGGGDTGLLGDTWQLGSLVHGSASTRGVACTGSAGLPLLTSQDPCLGNPGFTLDLLKARPSAACGFGFAAAPGNLALGGGCTLYLAAPIVTVPATTNGFGFANLPVPIPAQTALYGLSLSTQACVVDPQGAASGLAFSAGRTLWIGE